MRFRVRTYHNDFLSASTLRRRPSPDNKCQSLEYLLSALNWTPPKTTDVESNRDKHISNSCINSIPHVLFKQRMFCAHSSHQALHWPHSLDAVLTVTDAKCTLTPGFGQGFVIGDQTKVEVVCLKQFLKNIFCSLSHYDSVLCLGHRIAGRCCVDH